MIKKFSKNTQGRDWVVGDIHGCFLKLKAHLQEIGFNPEQGDRLFSVGDLVDRGPNSELALEWLDQPWFFAVRGNHEMMACDFYAGKSEKKYYDQNGGEWFTQLSTIEQEKFVDAFMRLPLAIQIETDHGLIGVVHAECPFTDWNELVNELEQPSENFWLWKKKVLWSRSAIENFTDEELSEKSLEERSQIKSLHTLFVGHTPLTTACVFGNIHYIDTGAVFQRGKFTVINITDSPQ